MDFPALPLSYTALVNLKPKQRINALVLVVSSNSPKRTRFGDFFLTCFVVDPSLPEGEVLTNIFRKEGQTIPKLEPGSLVELQDVEVQFHNKRQQICANGLSKVFLHKFDATGQLDVSCPIINSYLKRLVSLWETKISAGSTIDQLVPSQASGRSDIPNYVPGQKFKIFQSIKPGVYVDLAVEVIKVGPQNSKFAEMIVTDYTENRLAQVSSRQIEGDLMTSGRPLDFTVTLWDEHAHSSYFLSAKEGTRLLLLNCKAKLSASGVLEMAIHGEGKSVSRKIYPLSEDLSHKISERKESIIQELKMARDEQPNNLTCIKYPDAPICELENILNCNKVPNHFRTKGRIVEVWPKDDGLGISAFCRRICESCEAL